MRDSILRTAVLVGTVTLVLTELLSPFHLLTRWSLAAAWLLAAAEARLGAIDQARARLTALCDGSGDFKTAACNARTSLTQ